MERTLRFNGLPWYEPIQKKKILIVGAGGIGSWTALFLSRIFENSNVTVIDFDLIEEYNLAGQFYAKSQIGKTKVGALSNSIMNNYGGYITIYPIRVQDIGNITEYDYIISAVDNMEARKYIFDRVSSNEDKFIPIIDGRLLAESYQILTVSSPELLEQYKATLFQDSDVADLACSAKATTHCGASIAADITGLIVNMVTNEDAKDNIREVPFMISKHFDLMYYDTEIPKMFQTT